MRVASARGGRLERAIASAATVRDASAVVVEHLARTGLMPSVYLEQGGRLRCQASRGYWQVFDGMPSSAGVIGRTFRNGTATEVADIAEHPRAVARISALEDPEDIVRETVISALDLAHFESAMVALDDGHGGLYVHHAEGPFAVIFSDLDAAELAAIAGWVDLGTSSYTVAEAAGRGFAGHEPLRSAGAASLVVLPLMSAGHRMGVLVLADRTPYRLATDHVELLELLTVQAAGGLRMAAAVLELRERAARDPLTGLGHHATFHDTLPAVRRATAPGRSTAVLIADVDGFKEINDTRGHAAGDAVLRTMAAVMRSAAPAGGRAFRIGGDEFALVFECDGADAAERVGWQLRTDARDRLDSTVSIGVALAGSGEADEAVVARADDALYEVKRLGRDGVRLAPQA